MEVPEGKCWLCLEGPQTHLEADTSGWGAPCSQVIREGASSNCVSSWCCEDSIKQRTHGSGRGLGSLAAGLLITENG